jgi:hypothetical protein
MTSGSSTLRARFDRWRPVLERTLPPRCAADVITGVVHDLLSRLRQETEAESAELGRQFAQVHELLRATVTGIPPRVAPAGGAGADLRVTSTATVAVPGGVPPAGATSARAASGLDRLCGVARPVGRSV